MKTASWFTYFGLGRVSISRGVPRNARAGFKVYKALWPSAEMLKMNRAEYTPRYEAILAALEPRQVWEDLHELAAGAEPHLLCWERPPFPDPRHPTHYCHRHMAAAWLERELKVKIPELG